MLREPLHDKRPQLHELELGYLHVQPAADPGQIGAKAGVSRANRSGAGQPGVAVQRRREHRPDRRDGGGGAVVMRADVLPRDVGAELPVSVGLAVEHRRALLLLRARSVFSSSGMLNRGSRLTGSSCTREMSCTPNLHSRMMRLILRMRSSPASSASRAQRASKPQSWMANTSASKSGRYAASNGQLRKMLRSYLPPRSPRTTRGSLDARRPTSSAAAASSDAPPVLRAVP